MEIMMLFKKHHSGCYKQPKTMMFFNKHNGNAFSPPNLYASYHQLCHGGFTAYITDDPNMVL